MSSPSKIAKILVQRVNSTGEVEATKTACETFWKESPCFCRLAAKELSTSIKPALDKNNVRFIGIGFDSRFVQPFVQEGYFAGELYVDPEMECYKALQFQRFSFFDLFKKLLSKAWTDANNRSKSLGIKSDMKGDGFQNGGALVIDKNGKALFEYKQEDASQMVNAEDVLKALNIKE
ncbi:prostamide prostaglandin F synthase-like [Brachionus plicatilis]|uniref:Prostamide prostaglandin F synthase-like n=1 Tax=Brachionus plicatilis TaxID=10195 RepID=A0A3M7T0I1_BRAPC|nr:prostamide prostaglandin F synthase-like [Brachionus plicatilis]